MSAVSHRRQMDGQGSEKTPAAANALPQHMAGSQLQAVELGLPADSQVVSYQYLTRAKHSLAHVTIDELEETLQLPEEQLLPLEEVDVYENFLEVMQTMLMRLSCYAARITTSCPQHTHTLPLWLEFLVHKYRDVDHVGSTP